MKTSVRKELHTKTADELRKLVKDAQDALRGISLERKQNTLKNTRSGFNKRKELAVLQTILKEKEGAK